MFLCFAVKSPFRIDPRWAGSNGSPEHYVSPNSWAGAILRGLDAGDRFWNGLARKVDASRGRLAR